MRKLIYILIIILALIGAWHVLLPLLGGVVVVTAGLWGFAVASVIVFCVGILLLFLLTGIAGFLIVVLGGVWTVVAIALFPVLLPLMLPLLIILAFISYARGRQSRS